MCLNVVFFSLLGLGTSGFHAIILLHDILAFVMRFTVVFLPAEALAILTHRTSFLANNVSTYHYSALFSRMTGKSTVSELSCQ